ncbi:DUF1015 domain-containing protein [Chloroflexota bacterium]
MAEIRPFHGVHYNHLLVNDMATVICPPYDIITPPMQQELYQRSRYNFVRLEFGRELPQDTDSDNRYTRSSDTLAQWLKQGILRIGDTPAIYLHDHYFTYQEKECKRRGIIALVRLEDWDKRVVRPHEGTLTEPKGDRLSLLWALGANTSPILAMFEDREQQVSSLLTAQEPGEPILNVNTADGERHQIWAITEAKVVDKIGSVLAGQPLYIADGHHRYESALTYQREKRACNPSLSGEESFDFVMMTLVDFTDPGLVILPAHRLVRGLSASALDELMVKLKTFFELEELPLSMPDVWQQVDSLLAEGVNEVRLVLFGLGKEHLFVLRLRDFTAASQMMPYFHSELYKRLDVSVVDHIILEKLLGVSSDREEALLGYSNHRLEAVKKVVDGEYQLAFLLNSIRAEVVRAIADANDRMPRKSTYFYPKLPTGLIFHRLV